MIRFPGVENLLVQQVSMISGFSDFCVCLCNLSLGSYTKAILDS